MRSLSDTIERLARLRARPDGTAAASGALAPLAFTGSNPGALTGFYRMPEETGTAPALVVVLHGCTQNAAGYDRGSGWSALAEDYGFAVLFPEQNRQNNGNLCFNWFVPEDVRRDAGEVLSIRQMIDTMVTRHGVDPRRIFVTGLSAGGAMANSLLATYPELFAGGAIIGGLAHGVAVTVPEAFDRMRGHGLPAADGLQARLRAASRHQGPWPTVSVWQGTGDATVAQANAHAIVDQWRAALAVGPHPVRTETLDGQERRIWADASGRAVLDLTLVAGLGHGTPIDAASGYGEAGPYMLEAAIASTVHIARDWGLTPSFEKKTKAASPVFPRETPSAHLTPETGPASVKTVIESALRAAGLLR